jgi:hypothetical protein
VIAAPLKLIDDAGGTMTLSVAEMLKVAASGSQWRCPTTTKS